MGHSCGAGPPVRARSARVPLDPQASVARRSGLFRRPEPAAAELPPHKTKLPNYLNPSWNGRSNRVSLLAVHDAAHPRQCTGPVFPRALLWRGRFRHARNLKNRRLPERFHLHSGELQFFSDLEPLREASALARYLAPVRQTEWVVYAKPSFGGPQQVIEYLGRYTHRVAISNQRLLALQDGQVSFRWKDYRHPQQPKLLTVSAEEFIRRFLQHALPPGFQRIRYFGLLANCHRKAKLQLCRQQLAAPLAGLLPVPKDYGDFYAALTGKNLRLCPECGIGIMIRIEILPPVTASGWIAHDLPPRCDQGPRAACQAGLTGGVLGLRDYSSSTPPG